MPWQSLGCALNCVVANARYANPFKPIEKDWILAFQYHPTSPHVNNNATAACAGASSPGNPNTALTRSQIRYEASVADAPSSPRKRRLPLLYSTADSAANTCVDDIEIFVPYTPSGGTTSFATTVRFTVPILGAVRQAIIPTICTWTQLNLYCGPRGEHGRQGGEA